MTGAQVFFQDVEQPNFWANTWPCSLRSSCCLPVAGRARTWLCKPQLTQAWCQAFASTLLPLVTTKNYKPIYKKLKKHTQRQDDTIESFHLLASHCLTCPVSTSGLTVKHLAIYTSNNAECNILGRTHSHTLRNERCYSNGSKWYW